MQSVLPILVGTALVLALALPPWTFLKFSFRSWRDAPNPFRGVMFRALTILAAVGLAFNIAYLTDTLRGLDGLVIDPNWHLGVAFLISWAGFWGQRVVHLLSRRRSPQQLRTRYLG